MTRALILAAALGLAAASAHASEPLPIPLEPPSLADQVTAGSLPPIDKRLPEKPQVVKRFAGTDGPGRSGGQVNMLVATAADTRLMTVYGYSRLWVYDHEFKLQPDIVESWTVEEGRRFTLKLRPGHKWSDGQPFTSEDFRFFWEDVANNKDLSASGPPVELLVDEKPPRVEFPDATTVIYTWDKPNPYFLEAQARAAPLFLYRPAHYLKKFHAKYTPEADIMRAARQQSGRWVQAFRRVDVMYRNDNVDLPTLGPWVLKTAPPAQRFVFERNPYHHRIDANGVQLPYIDRVIFTLASAGLVPAKAGLGESDLQTRYINMRDYTFLKKGSKTSGSDVRLWESGSGSQLALYPNLNAKDEAWRKLMRDGRFRRALSLGIDRDELNEIVYIGLAKPSNNTVMARSELYKPKYSRQNATYDPRRANRLLDEIGLTKRNDQGIRLLPDGRSATIVLEHASEESEDNDALALITDHWKKIGIKLVVKPQSRENFRLRTFSGEAVMTAFAGATTAVPTIDTSPKEFVPAQQGGLQWSQWGLFVESKGTKGEKCDLPAACALLEQLAAWERSIDPAARRAAWERILATHAEEQFTIGTVNGVLQPVVVSPKLRNVPKEALFAWHPGGFIGLYKPDTFWMAP